MTKNKSIVCFVLAIIVIAGLCCAALLGIGDFLPSVQDGVVLGLDLTGGSVIVYEAQADNPTSEQMEIAQNIMRTRLDSLNYTEATVTVSGKQLRVEIPNVSDPSEAAGLLGSTASLTFEDVDGNVLMEGSDVKEAKTEYGTQNNAATPSYYIALTWQSDAVQKFADATAAVSAKGTGSNTIAICLDGETISAPTVTQTINDENCVITGSFTKEEADELSSLINAGQLPFAMEQIQLERIGATLGDNALKTSLIAGLIGIILVMLFMILFYRLPGLVASIALVCYSALTALVIVIFKVNLSLAGIAGVILAIGMAVDANVIIFERIKEELINGKSTYSAFRSGFKRAFTAILDSNVTTLIAAIVLMIFGSGSVKGFAITLFAGVLISMFTAVVVTRLLLSSIIGMGVNNPWLFGVSKKKIGGAK